MSPTEILSQLIAIASVNPMGRDVSDEIHYESRMSDWLVRYFQRIGAAYERIEVSPGRANVVARYQSKRSRRTLLLDAHQDTVPVEGMTIDPFDPVTRDGRVFGRGACDVKGGMAAMLHAFGRLFQERPDTGTDVLMSCTCDEESTMTGIEDLVKRWQSPGGRDDLLAKKPDIAVVAEPTELKAVVAHRGVLRFRVHTHGVAVHSSEPDRGRSAIYGMTKVLTRLQEIADELKRSSVAHPLCGPATISVGRIEGGTSVNIVPSHCQIEIDRRIIPGENAAEVFQTLADELVALGDDVRCDDPWVSRPALSDDDNGPVADVVLSKAEEIGVPKDSVGVAYCTHASTISDAGVPTVVFGPGSIAQAHTKDEYIEIDSLNTAAEVYFRVCADDSCWGD